MNNLITEGRLRAAALTSAPRQEFCFTAPLGRQFREQVSQAVSLEGREVRIMRLYNLKIGPSNMQRMGLGVALDTE